MFTVQTSRDDRLIMVKFEHGFWDQEVLKRFISECLIAARAVNCEIGSHRTVVELRNAILQSQTVISQLQAFMADPRVGRIALVATAPLERMQSRRLLVREGVQMFDDMDRAISWLKGPGVVTKAD